MAQIGAVVCSRVVGEVHPQAQRSTVWQIPGINGYGVHLHGLGDGECQWRAIAFGSEAVLGGIIHLPTWVAALRALQGTVVTIINDQGVSITNQLVRRVGRPQGRTANDLAGRTRRLEVQIDTITV